jgi:hypothetical protein
MPAWRQSQVEHGEKTPDAARAVFMDGLYVQIAKKAGGSSIGRKDE